MSVTNRYELTPESKDIHDKLRTCDSNYLPQASRKLTTEDATWRYRRSLWLVFFDPWKRMFGLTVVLISRPTLCFVCQEKGLGWSTNHKTIGSLIRVMTSREGAAGKSDYKRGNRGTSSILPRCHFTPVSNIIITDHDLSIHIRM